MAVGVAAGVAALSNPVSGSGSQGSGFRVSRRVIGNLRPIYTM